MAPHARARACRLGSRHRSRSLQLLHAAQMTSGSTHVAHGSCETERFAKVRVQGKASS